MSNKKHSNRAFKPEYVRTQAERASFEFTQNEVTELKKQLSNVNITVTQMSSLDAGLQKLSGTVDYLENQSRRSNLRIDGIAEIPGETWAQTEAVRAKLAKALSSAVDFHSWQFVTALSISRLTQSFQLWSSSSSSTTLFCFPCSY